MMATWEKSVRHPAFGFRLSFFALQSLHTLARREDFGLRWQSAAATPLWSARQAWNPVARGACESGVALRFPPQSKSTGLRLRRAALLAFSRGQFRLSG